MRKNTLKYAASFVTGILLTGPVGVMIGFGIDSLAIGLCIEHGDDEEAIVRTVGVIAGIGIGNVAKYADEVADLGDDVLGSVYKKKIASESSEYVDDVVRNTDVKQPKNISYVGNVISTGTLDDGLNFSNRAFKHMGEKGREVPIQTLQDAIRYGNSMPDPRGSSATMYCITMHKNGKMYNLEVLYDEVTNTIYHFEYARKAMGNLPAISK